MPAKIAKTIAYTGDRLQDEQQARTRAVAGRINALPFGIGRAISVRLAASVGTTITHGLGVPAAFIVIRQNYDGNGVPVAPPAESGPSYQAKLDLKNQLSIVALADCLIDLWFYPRASQPIPNGKDHS